MHLKFLLAVMSACIWFGTFAATDLARLAESAESKYQASNYEAASEQYRQLLAEATKAGNLPFQLNGAGRLADVLYAMEDFKAALPLYKEAEGYAIRLKNDAAARYTAIRIADVLRLQSENEEALAKIKTVLARLAPDTKDGERAEVLEMQARILDAMDDSTAARTTYNRALDLSRKAVKNNEPRALDVLYSVLVDLGDLESLAGRTDVALQLYSEGMTIAQASKAERAEASIQFRMLRARESRGAVASLKPELDKLIARVQALGDNFTLCNALLLRGSIHLQLNDAPAAMRDAEAADAAGRQPGGSVLDCAPSAKALLASVHSHAKNYVEAEKLLASVIEDYRKAKQSANEAVTLVQLASLLKDAGETARSRENYEAAYMLGKKTGGRCPTVKAASGLARLLLTDDPRRAETLLNEALLGAGVDAQPCAEAEARVALGELKLNAGDLEAARLQYKKAVDLAGKPGMDDPETSKNATRATLGLIKIAERKQDWDEAARLMADASKRAAADPSLQKELEAVRDGGRRGLAWSPYAWAAGAIAVVLVLFIGLRKRTSLAVETPTSGGVWFRESDSEVAFVFVHGILSDSATCWKSENGTFWPSLVFDDGRFGAPSVYLGGYYTNPLSGIFGIDDAAQKLLTDIRTQDAEGRVPLLSKKVIVFVAHSTGGLVVRYMLERYRSEFRDKSIGLVLVASPSRGSGWANRLRLLHQSFGNRMGGQLMREQDLVHDLDQRFADLISRKELPGLRGIDLFENHFVIRFFRLFPKLVIVRASDSASYFGSYRIVPGTDHFSIAKPNSVDHPSHRYLVDFWTGFQAEFGAAKQRGTASPEVA